MPPFSVLLLPTVSACVRPLGSKFVASQPVREQVRTGLCTKVHAAALSFLLWRPGSGPDKTDLRLEIWDEISIPGSHPRVHVT